MSSEENTMSVKWAVAILGVVAVIIGVSITVVSLRSDAVVNDFESCKAAGGTVMESYPEQCRYEDNTYINEAQLSPKQSLEHSGDYIGLLEESAMARAKQENTPARVVEREGEGLPVTMDYVYGRHSFYIKDGAVYRVQVEGQE